MQPLDGIDVLDFTQSIAGPTCTQSLALLGAEVVKVEPPEGDAFRPLIDGAMFASCNRGKRSLSIDLGTDEGKELATELAADADVIVESFRPGVMGRFGLDYESVSEYNEDVIYCSITGFGQDGPYEDYPAYDPVAQAMSGLMSVTGDIDGDPVRVGTSAIDYTTGLTSAMLIMGGLLDRASNGSEHIDISLFDVASTWMGYWVAYYTSSGDLPKRAGAGIHGFAPYGIFEAGDGQPFYLATASTKLYRRLCRTLDREDLLEDERFDHPNDRWEHRDVLRAELEDSFAEYDRRELVEILVDAGIPVGPLQYVDELVEDPHAEHRGLFTDTYNQTLETDCLTTRLPFRFSDGRPDELDEPPRQGEHTRELLAERGYDEAEIEALLDAGAIRQNESADD